MAKLFTSQNQVAKLDGTIYISLIVFLAAVISDSTYSEVQSIWKNLGGPTLNFDTFQVRYAPAESLGV